MRQKSQKQNFIRGAAVLTAATVLVKVIGMLYKIPLGNILGAGGMSHFMSAYSIFNPLYTLSVAGLPVAVSKMVSESLAQGRLRDMRRIRRVSMSIFLVTGILGTLLMAAGAGFFARLIGNPQSAPAIACMAPAIFFCCNLSAYRGYCQGMGNMTPTAVSQVVEAVAKLACGIVFANYMLSRAMMEFAELGTVFGQTAHSAAQAELLALPWAAAGAVLGVTASTAVGALYLFLRHMVKGDGIRREQLSHSPQPMPAGNIMRGLLRTALPVCLTAAVAHVSTLIDVATIMNRVGVAMQRDTASLLAQYGGILPTELAMEGVPSYLYGAYGYTMSLFNLVPALTVTLGISALPGIASCWALRQREQAGEQIRSVLKLSALLAIPAGLGLAGLAGPILELLYPARLAEVAIAAPLLRSMGIAAVFVGITTPMMSVFQAIGSPGIPVRLMLAGAVIKFAANYYLIAVPSLNILAAPLGTILCYSFIFFTGVWLLSKKSGIRPEMGNTFLRPLFCGIICMVAANTSYNLVARWWDSRLVTLAAIAVGGLFYGIFILFLGVISKKEIIMLPNGKKIAKILEKLSLLR